MKKGKITLVWGAILLIVLTPICINYGILREAKFAFVGNDTDWLAFWGSYLGGSLTAICGFVTLYLTIKYNRESDMRRAKQEHLKEMRIELTRYVSAINYSRICTPSLTLCCVENFPLSEKLKNQLRHDVQELNMYFTELTMLQNTIVLLYPTPQKPYMENFSTAYQNGINELTTQIDNMTRLIETLLDLQENNQIENIIQQINDILSNSRQFKTQYLTPIMECAQNWLKEIGK